MITKYKYANIEEGKRHLMAWSNEPILEVSGTTVSVVYSNKFQEVIDDTSFYIYEHNFPK